MVHSRDALIPTEPEPISNARLAAELQAVALGIRMFGLDGFSNMSAERGQEAPENERATPSQAQDGYGAAPAAECTPKNEWRPAKEVLSEESISRFKSQKDSGND